MATNYPTSIDSFTNPTSGDTLDSPSHAAQHANINDAMVAVQTKLGVGSGTIGTWTTYTPSWTNLTVGNGVQSAQYVVVNEICWVHGYIDFGSTSAITGGVSMTPPVAIDTSRTMNYHNIGRGSFLKGSVWPLTVLNFGGDFYFYVEQASATDLVLTNMNATRPAAYDSATWVSYQMAYPV